MSVEANKALVRRLFDEVYNQGNLAVVDEIQDSGYANFEKPWVTLWRVAFPDLNMRIDHLVGEGGSGRRGHYLPWHPSRGTQRRSHPMADETASADPAAN
jgi:hypothetical protein